LGGGRATAEGIYAGGAWGCRVNGESEKAAWLISAVVKSSVCVLSVLEMCVTMTLS
jgi:hypothetical protein